MISGREPAAQGANKPVLLGFTGSVNRRCGEADRGAHGSPRVIEGRQKQIGPKTGPLRHLVRRRAGQVAHGPLPLASDLHREFAPSGLRGRLGLSTD